MSISAFDFEQTIKKRYTMNTEQNKMIYIKPSGLVSPFDEIHDDSTLEEMMDVKAYYQKPKDRKTGSLEDLLKDLNE